MDMESTSISTSQARWLRYGLHAFSDSYKLQLPKNNHQSKKLTNYWKIYFIKTKPPISKITNTMDSRLKYLSMKFLILSPNK